MPKNPPTPAADYDADPDNPGSPIETHDGLSTDLDVNGSYPDPDDGYDAADDEPDDTPASLVSKFRQDDNGVDDIPEQFRFTTTQPVYDDDDEDGPTEQQAEVDKPIALAIDGMAVYLHQPPDVAMAWRMSQIMTASDNQTKLMAMMGILEASLDPVTMNHIKQKMLVRPQDGERFDDALIGDLVDLIVRKWGDKKQQEALTDARMNRAQKREQQRAARSKGLAKVGGKRK